MPLQASIMQKESIVNKKTVFKQSPPLPRASNPPCPPPLSACRPANRLSRRAVLGATTADKSPKNTCPGIHTHLWSKAEQMRKMTRHDGLRAMLLPFNSTLRQQMNGEKVKHSNKAHTERPLESMIHGDACARQISTSGPSLI